MIKYNTYNLKKVESIFTDNHYVIRYEKGSFKTGFCILHDKNVIVVNKFFTTEGKINSLLEVFDQVKIDPGLLDPGLTTFFKQLKQKPVLEKTPG